MNRMPAALGHDRSPTPRRRLFACSFGAVTAGLLVLATGASADLLTPESGGSPNADDIDSLYKLVLAVAVVVFVGVEGALLYSLIKFKARKGAVAAQIRGNTNLEIGWTVGAAVVLVVLAVVTFVKLDEIRTPPNSDAGGFQATADGVLSASAFRPEPPDGKALNIKVNGQQYIWRYTYPDGDENILNNAFSYEEMVVPTNTTVTLDIDAQDVAHSWWIPALGGKFDAIPGHTNYTWFKVPEPGVYSGQCAELCGRNHANMVATVRAVEPAEFERWLAAKRREIGQSNAAAQKAREKIEAQQQTGDEAP
ncbi:MAG: cytochrome c oxidase subunit II [Solirubrobacterales bacterium]|nr:cytochrome c oxidase subunit II [Solirubrobacterales bacterium]